MKVDYIDIIKGELKTAMGCTEPAAIALTTAYAAELLGKVPEKIELSISPYLFKNGMNVGLPGTNLVGLDVAAALGALSAKPEKELMVLANLSEEQKTKATAMVNEKRISIELSKIPEKIHVKATAISGEDTATAIISKNHTNLIFKEKNGMVIFEEEQKPVETQQGATVADYDLTIKEIVDFIDKVDAKELSFFDEVIAVNSAISAEGLTHDYGLKVGKSILNSSLLSSGSIVDYATASAAAAADARMSGSEHPVISTMGSGNQGITATIPIIAMSHKIEMSRELLYKALATSVLVTIHTKTRIGRLSVLCGCSIAAAIGTCCGIIKVFGGGYKEISLGINSMVGDISGVVCDGAKPGCALKIATAVSAAFRCAKLALAGIGANGDDGIVSDDVERTINNLGKLGNEGMPETNDIILDIMIVNGENQ